MAGGLTRIRTDASNAQVHQLEAEVGDPLVAVVRRLDVLLGPVPLRALRLTPEAESREPHVGDAEQRPVQDELSVDVERDAAPDELVDQLGLRRTRAAAMGVTDRPPDEAGPVALSAVQLVAQLVGRRPAVGHRTEDDPPDVAEPVLLPGGVDDGPLDGGELEAVAGPDAELCEAGRAAYGHQAARSPADGGFDQGQYSSAGGHPAQAELAEHDRSGHDHTPCDVGLGGVPERQPGQGIGARDVDPPGRPLPPRRVYLPLGHVGARPGVDESAQRDQPTGQ